MAGWREATELPPAAGLSACAQAWWAFLNKAPLHALFGCACRTAGHKVCARAIRCKQPACQTFHPLI